MWFKVDDKLHSHKKAAKAGDALALWVVAGSWCSDHLTDGFVPDYMVGRLMPGGDEMAQRLVDAGLWAPGECDGETGWQFHGWDEYQPTRDDVESQRERERDKKRKQRRTPKGQFEASPDVSPRDTDGTPEGTPEGVTPSRPDPTRTRTKGQNTRRPEVDSVFSAWVEATGRDPAKVMLTKDRRSRIEARLRDGYSPEDLIAAVRGVRHSTWHRGENDRGQRYDDLKTVLRDGGQVEKFRDLERSPPQPNGHRPRPKGMDAAEWLKAQSEPNEEAPHAIQRSG